MFAKNFFIYLFVIFLTAYPASAGSISLNRWVLNVTVHENGIVEEVIQAEIDNSGSLPLDGISFVVPASRVNMVYDFDHTASFTGQVVEQQPVQGGIKIVLNFNKSVEAGKKWNGRIGFTAENWAIKEGQDFSIDIPVKAPQAIVSGKDTDIVVQEGAEIRSQVTLPESIEVTSVKPAPFRILFQFEHMVPTWSPEKLKNGDVISIKSSFSELLGKIVETDKKINLISAKIKDAKKQGVDVSEAETHLRNAENYTTNQALGFYWKKENSAAMEYIGYANSELELAENGLKQDVQQTPKPVESQDNNKTPAFEAAALIFILLLTFIMNKKKNQ